VAEGKQKALVVDAHFDLLFDLGKRHTLGERQVIKNRYLPLFREGGVDVVAGAIYVDDAYLPEMALRQALDQVSSLYQELKDTPDDIQLCCTYQDIVAAGEAGKVAIILTMEGVEPLFNDLNLLPVFYQLGVRVVTLTHSRRNYAADGCAYTEVPSGKAGGLTDFGVKVVELAQRLGIVVDVSHLNEEGFWDAMEFCPGPVIFSHSNPKALCNVPRNVTNDQIKAIAQHNGVVCINATNLMLDTNPQRVDVSRYLDHVEYVADLVGVDFVGLGFDFCDHLLAFLSDAEKARLPKFFAAPGISNHREVANVKKGLFQRGFSESEVARIMGGNYLRVFKEVVGK
jgi:membrane dipeptidase